MTRRVLVRSPAESMRVSGLGCGAGLSRRLRVTGPIIHSENQGAIHAPGRGPRLETKLPDARRKGEPRWGATRPGSLDVSKPGGSGEQRAGYTLSPALVRVLSLIS
jgi:hypothetical protein